MAYLLDPGVLLRAFDPKSPQQLEILQAIDWLWTQKETLFVTVQNLAEFWNVATRPIDVNGLGLSVPQVVEQVHAIEDIALVLNESDASFRIWKKLVADHCVVGAKVHDARLASVMLTEGISSVLTLNERDFRRYPGVTTSIPSNFGPRPCLLASSRRAHDSHSALASGNVEAITLRAGHFHAPRARIGDMEDNPYRSPETKAAPTGGLQQGREPRFAPEDWYPSDSVLFWLKILSWPILLALLLFARWLFGW